MAFTTPLASSYAAIPAGSYFGYSTDGTTFTELPNIRGIGAIGETGTFVDVTPLSATTTQAIAGMKEAPEVTFTFLDAPDETDWTAFTTLAENGTECTIKIWLPNQRMVTGTYALNGFQLSDPSSDAPIECTVSARQNKITWATGENKPQ